MNRLLRWTLLPLSGLLIAPGFAAEDKKNDPKTPPKVSEKKDTSKLTPPKVPVKKDAENKLIKAGEIAGELLSVEPSKNSLKVKVPIAYSELNRGAVDGLRQAQIDLQKAIVNRDLNARNSALSAMVQHQRNLYTVKTDSKELTVDAADDCKVRMAQPKAAFDDMGNVKKLSAKDLAALRGKDRLFDAEFSDLSPGQLIRVTLVKPKTVPKTKDDVKLDDYKLQASRIVILRQPAPK